MQECYVSFQFVCDAGSSLKFKFNTTGRKAELVSVGKESDYNRFLLQFADSFYSNPETKTEYYISTNYMSEKDFVKYSERRRQTLLRFCNL